MDTNLIVGIVLIVMGLMDAVLGHFIIGPRVPDPAKRKVIVGALVLFGAAMVVAGVLLLGGLVRLE